MLSLCGKIDVFGLCGKIDAFGLCGKIDAFGLCGKFDTFQPLWQESVWPFSIGMGFIYPDPLCVSCSHQSHIAFHMI